MVAILVIGGYFGIALILAFRSVPAENKEPLLMVVGALGAAFGAIVAFYFTAPPAGVRASDTVQSPAIPNGEQK